MHFYFDEKKKRRLQKKEPMTVETLAGEKQGLCYLFGKILFW